MSDLIDRAIELSKAYRKAGDALLDRAGTLFQQGTITQEQYGIVYKRYTALVQKAVNIVEEASHIVALKMTRDITVIENATKHLQDAASRIAQIQEVIDVSASLIAAVGAVAVSVADPTHVTVTAAAAAIRSVAETINKYANAGGGGE